MFWGYCLSIFNFPPHQPEEVEWTIIPFSLRPKRRRRQKSYMTSPRFRSHHMGAELTSRSWLFLVNGARGREGVPHSSLPRLPGMLEAGGREQLLSGNLKDGGCTSTLHISLQQPAICSSSAHLRTKHLRGTKHCAGNRDPGRVKGFPPKMELGVGNRSSQASACRRTELEDKLSLAGMSPQLSVNPGTERPLAEPLVRGQGTGPGCRRQPLMMFRSR